MHERMRTNQLIDQGVHNKLLKWIRIESPHQIIIIALIIVCSQEKNCNFLSPGLYRGKRKPKEAKAGSEWTARSYHVVV